MMDRPRPPDISLQGRNAAEVLYWAAKTFPGRLAVTSSFQTQSVPLLHLISRICPEVPILFLDTGFHFQQTLSYRNQLRRRLGLNVRNLEPLKGKSELLATHGELYKTNAHMCCYLNKVEPLQRALQCYDAWISGVRRDQTKARAGMKALEAQDNGLYKICPMLEWTAEDVEAYRAQFQLPEHPLRQQGYKSIGCWPCTRAVVEHEDPRAGRWADQEKTECGLHVDEQEGEQ